MAAGAFTLIELLVVIAIIAILIGILFASFRYVRNAGARASTKVAMDTLNGMLGDYDAATHFSHAPVMWNWHQASLSPTPDISPYPGMWSASYGSFGSNDVYADFWTHPYSLTSTMAVPATNAIWEAQDNPCNVSTATGNLQRFAANSILDTQVALQMMVAIDSNRSTLAKLPGSQLMYLPYVNGNVFGNSGVNEGLPNDDGTDYPVYFEYPQGIHVTLNGKFFVSQHPTNAPVTDTYGWYDESAALRGVPLVLDGWGNPILFVPASGLHVRLLNGKSAYSAADTTQDFIIISPEGVVINQGTGAPIVTKPGRPFWASAGPDGDFAKGDDNIYSFEH